MSMHIKKEFPSLRELSSELQRLGKHKRPVLFLNTAHTNYQCLNVRPLWASEPLISNELCVITVGSPVQETP